MYLRGLLTSVQCVQFTDLYLLICHGLLQSNLFNLYTVQVLHATKLNEYNSINVKMNKIKMPKCKIGSFASKL